MSTIHVAAAAFYYHWEDPEGRRTLSARSTARNIAVFREVAAFFGGRLKYKDHESSGVSVPDKNSAENHPSDGEPWDNLQRRMFALKPITRKQIKACESLAAYG